MKKLIRTLSILLLFLSSTYTLRAAQDEIQINVDVEVIEYIHFIGTLVDAAIYFSFDDIEPTTQGSAGPRLTMGTLGLESNQRGDCVVQFTTKNNFRLSHVDTNQRLSNYRIIWKGENVKRLPNRELTLPCNTVASDYKFQTVGPFLANPTAGIYQDIMTLTVTTQ